MGLGEMRWQIWLLGVDCFILLSQLWERRVEFKREDVNPAMRCDNTSSFSHDAAVSCRGHRFFTAAEQVPSSPNLLPCHALMLPQRYY
jgi:hypothetical protein